jgi:hypothetical protein
MRGLVLVMLAAGCATPLLHPLRAQPGPVAENAISFAISAGERGGCGDGSGCKEGGARAFVPNLIQVSAGYAVVAEKHFGLLAGAYFPAWENMRTTKLYGGMAAYSYGVVQGDKVALGAGPELGVGGWALTTGADLRPWGTRGIRPGLGVYTRFFFPWQPDYQDFDGRMATWEAGARLNVGPFYVQYAYVSQYHGARDHELWETSFYEQAFHIISIGVTSTSIAQALRTAGMVAGALMGGPQR